jgi:hypothetical protein
MNNIFYVYIHKRLTDGEIFYVGKGKGKRAFSTYKRNPHWCNVVAKHGYSIEIIFENLSEFDAFQTERDTILELLNFGSPLTNKTIGGEGVSGYKHSLKAKKQMSETRKLNPIVMSDETKAKLLKAHIGAKRSKETCDKIRKAASTPERKSITSKTHKGKIVSPETRLKLSISNKLYNLNNPKQKNIVPPKPNTKKNQQEIFCSNGMHFFSAAAAIKWLRESGISLKAQSGVIMDCCRGKYKNSCGLNWSFSSF